MGVQGTQSPKAKRVLLKFTRNVCYEGKDYGPAYKADTIEVDAHWAQTFLNSGKAELAKAKAEAKPEK